MNDLQIQRAAELLQKEFGTEWQAIAGMKNPHYEDRIRATIYEHPDQYLRTAPGCYRLSYAVA